MKRQPIVDRLTAIEARLAVLEAASLADARLGPNPRQDEELERDRERMVQEMIDASRDPEPVDRSCRVLVSGAPVPEDNSHTEHKDNGQQKDYVILCDAERSKGFVRPYRDAYRHLKCGTVTTMSRKIAETYARDPFFYSGTFCCGCGAHFPVGENGEFVWLEMGGGTGPKVGT